MGHLEYQLGLQAENLNEMHLLYITESSDEGDWSSLLHAHYFTELFYVRAGSGYFQVGNEEFPIERDDLIIVNPNISHTEVSDPSHPLSYITLAVDGLSFAFSNQKEHMIFHCMGQQSHLLFYFSSMLAELEKKQDGWDKICVSLLNVLIIRLGRMTNTGFEVQTADRAGRERARVRRYIDAHYQEDLSLEALANMAHLNKYYLVHSFTEAYGRSPINYLNERRISVSRALLETTDHSIAEIARLSGFASQSYFAQSFKKSCGMTAGAYRKLAQKDNQK